LRKEGAIAFFLTEGREAIAVFLNREEAIAFFLNRESAIAVFLNREEAIALVVVLQIVW
jgi:hypothetical protein